MVVGDGAGGSILATKATAFDGIREAVFSMAGVAVELNTLPFPTRNR